MSNRKAHLITTALILGLLGFTVSMLLWPFMMVNILAVGILLLFITMIYVVVYDSIKKGQ
jgi:hypothetical protein